MSLGSIASQSAHFHFQSDLNFFPNDLFPSIKLGSWVLGLIFHQQVEKSSVYIQNINSPKGGHIDSRIIYLLCLRQKAHTLGESEEERAEGYWHYQVWKQKAQSISISFVDLNHNFYWQFTISKRHFSIKCNSRAICFPEAKWPSYPSRQAYIAHFPQNLKAIKIYLIERGNQKTTRLPQDTEGVMVLLKLAIAN